MLDDPTKNKLGALVTALGALDDEIFVSELRTIAEHRLKLIEKSLVGEDRNIIEKRIKKVDPKLARMYYDVEYKSAAALQRIIDYIDEKRVKGKRH